MKNTNELQHFENNETFEVEIGFVVYPPVYEELMGVKLSFWQNLSLWIAYLWNRFQYKLPF